MDSISFAKSTKKILEALPYWFSMRKRPQESKGAAFLNVIGMEVDEFEEFINYAYQQTKIDTADINMMDVAYKIVIPEYITKEIDNYVIAGDGRPLRRVYSMNDFFFREYPNLKHPELNNEDVYYFDEQDYTIYVRTPYGKSNLHVDGKLTFIKGEEWIDHDMVYHNVWNFFDEFGMLLTCPRLKREKNDSYKLRILDVFKNPANASRGGLANGIARELGQRITKTWDVTGDFEIKDPMVMLNHISVNGIIVNEDRLLITKDNTIVIKDDGSTKPVEVSYISGIELHALNNEIDYPLMRQLFKSNRTATELLKQYAKIINDTVPIMWGQFTWDEGRWDVSDENMSGFGCLPHIADASIEGLSWYDPTNPLNTKRPELVELYIHPGDITIILGDECEIEYMQLVGSFVMHPNDVTIKRGDIIEIETYG